MASSCHGTDSSDSKAVGGVVKASAHNIVQSILRRFIRLSQRGVQVLCTMFYSEKFICEVEAHPPLYNVQLKEYSKRSEGNTLGRNQRSNV
jgi:hypothetical protein